jgi:hypothetical protein
MQATLARWWAAQTQSRIAAVCICLGVACFGNAVCTAMAQTAPVQAPPSPIDKDISDLVLKLEAAAASGDPKAYLALTGPDADRSSAENFATLQIRPGVTRAVLRERDRLPITDVAEGTGYVLVVDAFIQFGDRGSVSTWRLDVRRYDASGGSASPGSVRWLVHGQDRLTSVEGLYKLHLNTKRQFRINNLKLTSEDLLITIPSGFAFAAESDQGQTALVLVGQGEMTFSPKPAAEKGQVKLLAGEEALKSKVRSAFVRVNPGDLNSHFSQGALAEEAVRADALETAQEIFDEQVGKSFGLDLNDLSRDTWSLVPPIGDFLTEIATARFGTLTYTQANNESEDISLFDRRKRRNISAYASARKLAQRGRFYADDEQVDYVAEHYDIQTNFAPERNWLEGRTVLKLRVRSYVLGTLTLRLADSLVVHSVTSPRFGRLLSLRVKGQNSVLVNLPAPLSRGDEITLAVSYAGRLETATPEREVLALQDQPSIDQHEITIPPEKRTIYTNRSYWYPQSPVPMYATAQMRFTVPDGVTAVASGTPAQGNPVRLEGTNGAEPRRLFVFSATQPARYFAVILTRLSPPVTGTVKLAPENTARSEGNGSDPGLALVFYSQMELGVLANPRQTSRARGLLEQANTILSTYANIVRDVPYPSLTLTLVDDPLPGGHSPAYFTILHQPLPMGNYSWRGDPVNFDRYPQFFIAHELAHQFWGDAVGGENYHEQWISEGFAQYFALLYAERTRSRDTFEDILKQLRRTSIAYDRNGPVWLGYRLGHLQGDSRIFRALVYNKGALVLHMLRRLIGDEAFFRGLRRFYQESRFKKVGTDEVMKAFEAESGQSLERFFERWILEAGVPQVAVNYAIEDVDSRRAGPPMSQARTPMGVSPSMGNSAIGSSQSASPSSSSAPASQSGQSVLRVKFEQKGEIYDFPITVRVRYASGEIVDTVIPVTDRVIEQTVPLKGRVENVEINPDEAALVELIRR